MKIFLAGAVTGTTEKQLGKYSVYQGELKKLFPKMELTTPDVIWEYRQKVIKKYPEYTKIQVDEAMVKFDLKRVRDSDYIVCDLSSLSTGLGIELGVAVENKKKIVFFFEKDSKVSNMITGAFPKATFIEYKNTKELIQRIKEYFNSAV